MRMHRATVLLAVALSACGSGANKAAPPAPAALAPRPGTPVYSFEVVNSWPHDPEAFTQGLVFHQGALYESTGLHGRSSLRQVDIASGKPVRVFNLPGEYFAEGMTVLEGKIFQLTWKNQKGFIYDLESFRLLGEFSYRGEGWGLTTDGKSLIVSDGTEELRFINPRTFAVDTVLRVYDGDLPVRMLNELEYVRGEIYANVWQSDYIVRIDPRSGRVLGWINLAGIRAPVKMRSADEVLNGIAYDQAGDRLFVTGKLWPHLFEIRVVRQ